MDEVKRTRVLGCPVDLVDMDVAVKLIGAAVDDARAGKPRGSNGLVVTLNPEILMQARRRRQLAQVLEDAYLIIPDGAGLVTALRRRGFRKQRRVTGIDLVSSYLPQAEKLGHRVAFVGAAPGIAERAAELVRRKFPDLKLIADSGDPNPETVIRIRESRAEVVLAAYGGGVQEIFLEQHLGEMGAAVGIGVGGTLDYFAGAVKRAPKLVRDANLEWGWRLAMQPWRIKRQLVLPQFWWLERREAAGSGR
jgi:N-acetylglucosaminyldiphosphoundecaprenol N-acetyl-beta-D-mannosaminyltransferase